MKTSHILNERQLCDLEMIINGAFSPLKGFMNQKDYESVINHSRLSNGKVWPLPIVLSIPKKDIDINIKFIELFNKENLIAVLKVEDIYEPDIEEECLKTLGSFDDNHPYVSYLKSLGDVYNIGGTIEKKEENIHYDFLEYRLTPIELKEKIEKFERILGFQTRNPMHNCHYYLTINSLEQIPSSNKCLVLMPVVGVTQEEDVEHFTRVRCYIHMMKKYKEVGVNVFLCLLPLSMRMAGPREALWHSLIRKNYGCTDFTIGRDHAGPSKKTKSGESFYKPTAAHEYVSLFEKEININIIKSNSLVYDQSINKYVLQEKCKFENMKNISGTELRRILKNGENIPEWFTLPEISKELKNFYSKGICFYLIGLSGSGKTTISQALYQRLKEKYNNITLLDGDIIRDNLGQKLGFSKEDRSMNVRRIGYIAKLLVENNGIVICSNIAPYEEDRLYNREIISSKGKYIEIYINTTLEICEKRDVKGLYKKVRNGEIKNFTGIDDPFESPKNSDLIISGEGNMNEILDKIISLI